MDQANQYSHLKANWYVQNAHDFGNWFWFFVLLDILIKRSILERYIINRSIEVVKFTYKALPLMFFDTSKEDTKGKDKTFPSNGRRDTWI